MHTDGSFYAVSGANRGIGYALVERLSTDPNVVIYAGARNPSGATKLHELSKSCLAKINVVKLDSLNYDDPATVAKQIESEEGKIDVIIANAGMLTFNTLCSWSIVVLICDPGIAKHFGPLATTPLSEFQDHFDVNTKGVIALFQATHALLEKSEKPTFVLLSSVSGSIDAAWPFPVSA